MNVQTVTQNISLERQPSFVEVLFEDCLQKVTEQESLNWYNYEMGKLENLQIGESNIQVSTTGNRSQIIRKIENRRRETRQLEQSEVGKRL